jgi:HEPN domain-containing protein
MTLSQKDIRELVGHTFLKVEKDPENWFRRACQFNSVANLINDNPQLEINAAYYFNAGLSLELALKSIIIAKSKPFGKTHTLIDLSKDAGIRVSKDQECTLELLSEIIIWSGRYPTPTREEYWDNYYDKILEKHMIRQQIGNTGSLLKNESRFPTHRNYQALWKICKNEFSHLQPETESRRA